MSIVTAAALGIRAQSAPMMARPPPPTSLPAIAERLQKIQHASGLNQADFARLCGISKQSWNQYVNGERRISPNHAIKICETISGLSMDYIFRGIGADPQVLLALLRSKLPPPRA